MPSVHLVHHYSTASKSFLPRGPDGSSTLILIVMSLLPDIFTPALHGVGWLLRRSYYLRGTDHTVLRSHLSLI